MYGGEENLLLENVSVMTLHSFAIDCWQMDCYIEAGSLFCDAHKKSLVLFPLIKGIKSPI